MPTVGLDILTNSEIRCFRACQERHWVTYDLGIRKIVSEQPLRMGSAVHEALDAHAKAKMDGLGAEECMMVGRGAIDDEYFTVPKWADEREWYGERERCRAMFIGYVWRWMNDPIEYIETEKTFDLPIVNPKTGRASRAFRRGGKIDKIAIWHGLKCVEEHKTTGESIDPESDYWKRLRVDSQISGYFISAMKLGHDVETILYDVIHKPGMRPLDKIPCLDTDGLKIVVHKETCVRMHKANGDPYLTAGREEHTFLYRQETIEEYGKRLLAAIYSDPDKYYARKEIPRTHVELERYERDLWATQQEIRTARREGWHPANDDVCTKPFMCPIRDHCWEGYDWESGPPPGFEIVDSIHPELEINGEKNGTRTAAT